MKKSISFFILAIVFCFLARIQAQVFEEVLTEELSIKRALASNIEILEVSKEVDYAKQKVIEAEGLYFPTISFNANASHFNNTFSTLVLDPLSQNPILLPSGIKELYISLKCSIWQNIYTGGRIRTTNDVIKINKEKIENKKDIITEKVINDVKVIFNECLYCKELLAMDLEKLKSVELGKIQLPFENIKKLRKKCTEKQLLYEKEVLNLLSVIGKDLNTNAEIQGKLFPKIKHLDLEKCLFLAYQFKPELRSSQNQEKMDNLTLNLLSLQKFPNATFGCVYEWSGEKHLSDSLYFSFNVNIPIFDGGIMFSRFKQGAIKLRQSVLARSKAERDISLCVNKNFLEYNFWKTRAIESNLLKKNHYYEDDIELIRNLNRSYYNLELAIGVDLDSY
ncbi:MAG: TolC family protein [Endomicrobium sp.]|jgi:outer membrane protein TolC|nr:TolC family protein [Endomicrobium sp.]